jgi:uncharacterized LabA/DUF88 family protein
LIRGVYQCIKYRAVFRAQRTFTGVCLAPASRGLRSVQQLHKKGFNPTVYERNFSNKEKKVDVAIGARMTKDAYTLMDKTKDELLLVAGDSDFAPVVADLTSEGFKVEVAFWDHAAREIKETASKFISLNQYHGHFTR